MRRFQDEVRSALLKYALTPGLLVALICIFLAALYWERNVVTRTAEEARTAGEIFTELTHDYEARAAALAMNGTAPIHGTAQERRLYFERLYAELSLHGTLPRFYLMDAERQMLFQTHAGIPSYLESPPPHWGVLSRMDAAEGCVQEFVPRGEHEWDYVVGQAIHAPLPVGQVHGAVPAKTEGYAVFVMSVQELAKRLQTGEKIHVVLADRAGRAPFSTMTIFRDPVFHKIVPEVADAHGLVEVEGQQFYVVQEPVLDGHFTVYAILPVGSRIARIRPPLRFDFSRFRTVPAVGTTRKRIVSVKSIKGITGFIAAGPAVSVLRHGSAPLCRFARSENTERGKNCKNGNTFFNMFHTTSPIKTFAGCFNIRKSF